MPRAKKMSLPSTPTGLPYGENKALADSQNVVPIKQGQTQPATIAPAPLRDPLAVAQEYATPNVGLGEPTARPNEHVMTGVDAPMAEVQTQSLADPDIENLRVYLPILEHLAGLPTATIATRNLVRRLRGAQQ